MGVLDVPNDICTNRSLRQRISCLKVAKGKKRETTNQWFLMNIDLHIYLINIDSQVSSSKESLGQQVLIKHGLNFNEYLYWIPVGALVGIWVLYNLGFTLALSYLKRKFSFVPFHACTYMQRRITD